MATSFCENVIFLIIKTWFYVWLNEYNSFNMIKTIITVFLDKKNPLTCPSVICFTFNFMNLSMQSWSSWLTSSSESLCGGGGSKNTKESEGELTDNCLSTRPGTLVGEELPALTSGTSWNSNKNIVTKSPSHEKISC